MKPGGLGAALGAVVTVIGIGALGGAATGGASTTGQLCADRPFCVTLIDQDEQSRSTDSSHYMKYVLVIERDPDGGTSQLTNGKAVLTLTDILGAEDVVPDDPDDPNDLPSNAVFQEDASDGDCSAGNSGSIVTCVVPNLPAGAGALVYEPLIFTTTSRADVPTRAVAEVSFKEKGNDNQPVDPNRDTIRATNFTSYEPEPDVDRSWAYPTATLDLVTSATDDEQHTAFPLSVPATATASFTASVEETPVSGSFCPTCYGEIVATNTGGNSAVLFSASKPAHVVITWDFLPSGKTKNNIFVKHQPDSGDAETITASCTFGTEGVPTNLPCRDVTIERLGGGAVRVTISAYSAGNGGWGVG